MKKKIVYKKTTFFYMIFISFFLCTKAQVIDTVNSEYAYSVLTSCKFNKTIIDGRDSLMFCSGHIKNAVYIDAFSKDIEKTLQKFMAEDTLFIYCTNKTRSEIIIENLISLNYNGLIIYMRDGINGWKKNEYDLVIPLNNKNIN